MICYHGNGGVVLPLVINQIQITFITYTQPTAAMSCLSLLHKLMKLITNQHLLASVMEQALDA